MATGIIGQNLKDRPDVYVSSSAGYQWRPVSSQILSVQENSQYCRIIIICGMVAQYSWISGGVCVGGGGGGGGLPNIYELTFPKIVKQIIPF